MDILVTGGSGFIGRYFINRYDQHHYWVLTRSPRRAERILGSHVDYMTDLAGLSNLDDFDAVINLAGEPIIDKRWSSAQKKRICDSRWSITQTLVDLCIASNHPPAVFISGSAIGFYGDSGSEPVTEQSTPASNDFAHQLCRQWENIARQAETCTRVVMLRTGIVLGNGGALNKMLLPFKLGLGGKIGSGQQYMSWIHIDDMARAIEFLLLRDSAVGPFNLTAVQALTNEAFTHTLAQCLNTKARLAMPEKLLRLLMGESADLLLGSQNIYPQKLLDSGFKFGFNDLQSALVDVLLRRQ